MALFFSFLLAELLIDCIDDDDAFGLSQLVGKNNTKLGDVCFKPMEPDVDSCTVQSAVGWWQGREDYLNKTINKEAGGINFNLTYLDHVIYCTK